ncbi:MAG: D-alanyl-D-alanine carboxypeptidase/D-alanyl-D-alanine-endopeptidase [Longimicrobiales bacterium]
MRVRLVRFFIILVPGILSLALLPFPSRRGFSGPAPLSSHPATPTASSAGVHLTSALTVRASVEADLEVEELRRDLRTILTSTGNRNGRWSVLAVSMDQGDTLLALNVREPMVPASNMKVLTTAAALYALGPDFRYTTFLLTDGQQRGEELDGDLILYGTGDPTLSDRFFQGETAALDTLAGMIRERGIREIRGDLVIDGSYFQGPEIHPEWSPKDLNDPFAAPVAAVIFNENLVTVRVEASRTVGFPPLIHAMPEGSGIPVLNTAITAPGGTRPRVWLFRETPWDPIGIEGEIPVGGRDVWRELPVPDPLVFTGRILRSVLKERGIHVSGHVRVLRNPSASVLPPPDLAGDPGSSPAPVILAVHESPPLLDILTVVNKESNNLLAESVARTLGRLVMGDGSFEGGMAAVAAFLTSRAGVPRHEFNLRDGSGLSPENRISAGALVQVLTFMAESPLWDDFWSTLPEAGVRRELRRMGAGPAARNLRAKTGTMRGVSALSGMVRTRSGERVLFSILSNEVSSEYRAKRAEDQLGIRLASLSRASNRSLPQKAVSELVGGSN